MQSKPTSSDSQSFSVGVRRRLIGKFDRKLEKSTGYTFFPDRRRPDSPPRPPGIPMPPIPQEGTSNGPPGWLRRDENGPIVNDAPPLYSELPSLRPRSNLDQRNAPDPDYRISEYCLASGGTHNGPMYNEETPGRIWYPIKHTVRTDWCYTHGKEETVHRTRYEKGPAGSATFTPRHVAYRIPPASVPDSSHIGSSHEGKAGREKGSAAYSQQLNVVSLSNHACALAPTYWDLESAGQNPSGREPRDIMVIWNCATDNRNRPPPEHLWRSPSCEVGWQPTLVNFDAGQSYCENHKMAESFYRSVYTRVKANSLNIAPLDINSQSRKAEQTNESDVSEKLTESCQRREQGFGLEDEERV